jgi:FKBP-type peptidyl-prolyl cis-trans isomerase SlyD
MQIAAHKVVTIDYTLRDDAGNIIDQSDGGEFAYLHGAHNIIPGLEKALTGRSPGDELTVSIAPEEGYGVRDESRVDVVPRSAFPRDTVIEVGMQFQAQGPQGQAFLITVSEVEGDDITVDGNHPLAGVGLSFEVTVVDVRDATAEELRHGHVHGPGGHAHD